MPRRGGGQRHTLLAAFVLSALLVALALRGATSVVALRVRVPRLPSRGESRPHASVCRHASDRAACANLACPPLRPARGTRLPSSVACGTRSGSGWGRAEECRACRAFRQAHRQHRGGCASSCHSCARAYYCHVHGRVHKHTCTRMHACMKCVRAGMRVCRDTCMRAVQTRARTQRCMRGISGCWHRGRRIKTFPSTSW